MGVGVVVSGEAGVMGTVGVGVGVIVGDGGGIVLWPPPLQFQVTEKEKSATVSKSTSSFSFRVLSGYICFCLITLMTDTGTTLNLQRWEEKIDPRETVCFVKNLCW
jgi:hypothetical protein